MRAISACACGLTLLGLIAAASGQLQDRASDDSVRVTVAQNQDGSRTSYQYDNANRKAVATTVAADGKVVSKIRYDLDEKGRFKAGEIYDGKEKLRFRTEYKYDPRGRLESETQLAPDGNVRHKLVYSYNDMGKQTGYTVYDGNGKLLGRSTGSSPGTTPAK